MDCETCHHQEHRAGNCDKCNCGESELILPSPQNHQFGQDYGDLIYRIYRTGERKRNNART